MTLGHERVRTRWVAGHDAGRDHGDDPAVDGRRPGWPRAARAALRAVERALRRDARVTAGRPSSSSPSPAGPISVFLLRALHALAPIFGLSLRVAHLDHGWRGDAAVEDAAWTKALAVTLGIPFSGGRVDAPALAAAEASPRKWPPGGCATPSCESVAGDAGAAPSPPDTPPTTRSRRCSWPSCAETGRPAWPACARAARCRSETPDARAHLSGRRMIRPLLDLRRDALRSALGALDRTGEKMLTNLDRRLPRNRLRLDVLPSPGGPRSGVRAAVCRAAGLVGQAGAYVQETAQRVAADLFRARPRGSLRARRRPSWPSIWPCVARPCAGPLHSSRTTGHRRNGPTSRAHWRWCSGGAVALSPGSRPDSIRLR